MAGNYKTAIIILISLFKALKIEMEDLNLIVTLISVNRKKRAEKVFCRKENKRRYLPFI